MTVLVTAATGNVGSAVVRHLSRSGEAVRAFVRDPNKAAERLGNGAEIAVGDFSDRESLRRALEGTDRVFLSSADGPDKVEHEIAVIDEAAAAGVKLIVKASTIGADPASPLPPWSWNGRSEDHLRESGVPAVVLRSYFYMTNLFASADAVRQTGKLFAPADGAKIAMIDPDDVGAVAALLLSEGGHEGQTYLLSGPDSITHGQVAEELSAATGRSVEFVPVPEEAARQGLVEAGAPEWLVDHLIKLFGVIREGRLEEVTGTVQELTGREPRAFGAFARDHAAVFGG